MKKKSVEQKNKSVEQESPALRLYKATLKLGRLAYDYRFGEANEYDVYLFDDAAGKIILTLWNVSSYGALEWFTAVARDHCDFKASPELIQAVIQQLREQAIEAAKKAEERESLRQGRKILQTQRIKDALAAEIGGRKS